MEIRRFELNSSGRFEASVRLGTAFEFIEVRRDCNNEMPSPIESVLMPGMVGAGASGLDDCGR